MVLLIGNITLNYVAQKSLIRIDLCDVNRVYSPKKIGNARNILSSLMIMVCVP